MFRIVNLTCRKKFFKLFLRMYHFIVAQSGVNKDKTILF